MQNFLANAVGQGEIHTDKLAYGPEVTVNWVAIIVATLAAMVIGSLWYGPLFGKRWMKLVKLDKKGADTSWKKPMLIMLVFTFVQAVILAHFIAYAQYYYFDTSELTLGVLTGFWAWAGFVLPAIGGGYLFAKRPAELAKIDLGNFLVILIAMGAIIAAIS